jgi:hypothetical protein
VAALTLGIALFAMYDKKFQAAYLEFPSCRCRNMLKKFIDLNPWFLSFFGALISVFLHTWLICGTLIGCFVGNGVVESPALSLISIIFIALHIRAFYILRGSACGKKLS